MKNILHFILCLSLFISTNLFSQAPTNDECSQAISLNVNAVCNYQTFTNLDATASLGVADPTCSAYGGGDVWFQFIAPVGGAVVINSTVGVITDGGMSVYSGTCGSLTEIACDDDNSENGNMPKIALNGLTPNNTYYIRFWEYNGDFNGTFQICISLPAPPPINDECVNAINLSSNIDLSCLLTTSGTLESATTSIENNTCGGTADDDVWFKFQATNTSHTVGFINAIGSTTDLMLAVYSGTCANLTQLSCNEFFGEGKSINNNLNIGDTYIVRIYSWTANSGQNTDFDVCIGTPPPPPTNDDCNGAIQLTVGTSCIYSDYSNVSATASLGAPDPGCAGYNDGDVWFKFIVPANGNVICNMNQNGGLTDSGMAWYTGDCSNLTLLECDDDDSENGLLSKISRTGLTPGETIYVRVWGYGSNNSGTFQICASEPANPPANDECDFPVGLPVNPDNNCLSFVTGTTENATASIQANNCNGNADDDVWYSFVATNSTHSIEISNILGNTTIMNHSVYSGACASLGNALLCSNTNSSTISGLTIGNTYLIRIYSNGDNPLQVTSYDLCVKTPPPPPSNDDCINAINLPVNTNCTFSSYTNLSATDSGITNPGCAMYNGADVWFKFVAPAGGSVKINSNTGSMLDGGMALYSGNCGNLNFIECDDDDSENGNMPSITRNDLIPGNTYYVRFWEYNGDNNGTFDICVSLPPSPPINDECINSISVLPSTNSNCSPLSSTITGATSSLQVNGCSGTSDDDVWFSFVANNTNLQLDLNNIVGSNMDLYHSVYSGACTNLGTPIICSDPNTSNLTGLTIGQTYIVRVYSWTSSPNQTVDFDICITNPAVTIPIISFGTTTNPSSCGGNDGSIVINGSNTGVGSLSWSGTSSGTVNNITLPYTVTGLTQGNYTFIFNNGTASDPISTNLVGPNAPATPTISASGPSTFCQGGSVNLTSSTAASYLWSNGATTQSINVTTSGNYYVTIFENSCSSISATFNVFVNPNPIISLGSTINPTACGQANGSILINGSGSGSLSWTGSYSGSMGPVTLNSSIQNLNSGVYNVYFTDNNSCVSNVVSATLSDPNAPSAPTITTSGSTDICNGSSVTLTSSALNGNTWSNGATTQSITVNSNGMYYVTYTLNSCISNPSETILVNVIPNVTPSISIISSDNDNQICLGANVIFSANVTNGGGNPIYQWKVNGSNVGNNSNTFSSSSFNNGDIISCVLTSNEYCVSPNNAVSNSIVLSVQSSLTPSITILSNDADNTICGGTNVIFTASSINSGSNPQYNWMVNGITVGSNINTFNSNSLNNGDVISCVLTSNESCASTNTATSNYIAIQVVTSLTPTISISSNSNDNTFCNGSNVSFTSNITSGGTNPIYQWKVNGTNVGINSNTFTSSSLNNGDVVSCVLTSNDLCASINTITSNTVVVNIINTLIPTVNIVSNDNDNSICPGTNVIFTATPSNAGATPTYSWFINGILQNGNSNTFSSSILTQNDLIYCQLFSNESCANPNNATSNTISISLTPNPFISTGLVINPSDCGSSDGSIEIVGQGIGTLTWINQSTGISNNIYTALPDTIFVLNAGIYDVSFNLDGCISNGLMSTLTEPSIPSTPIITASGSTTICQGEILTLTSSNATTYLWSTNESTQAINVNSSGEYFITVYNTPNCYAISDTIVVTVNSTPSSPVITASGNTTFCEGENVVLTSSSNNGNTWSNGSTNNTIVVTSGGIYTATITENGCISAQSNQINVVVNPIPNVTIASISDVCDTSETFVFNQGLPAGGSYIVNGNSATNFDPSIDNIGIITVTYTYTQNSCSNSAETTFNVLNCSGAGISNEKLAKIVIYPNPANNYIYINGIDDININDIKIYDAIGKLVLKTKNSNYIDISTLSNGYYNLVINNSGNIVSFPVNILK